MSLRIFLLRDSISIEAPFSDVVNLVKRRTSRGRRFKIKVIESNRLSGFYSYRDTIYARLGYLTTFENEFVIRPDLSNASRTLVEFRMPAMRMILNFIVGVAIVCFLLLLSDELDILWTVILLATLYFGVVIHLNSQFHYLKWDIEKMEGSILQIKEHDKPASSQQGV